MPTEGIGQDQQIGSTVEEPTASEKTAVAGSAAPLQPTGRVGTRRRRHLPLALASGTALASAALTWLLAATGPLKVLELKTYDLRFVLRGKLPPPQNILLVTMDPRTEATIPEPRIFWHRYYAALFRAAAAAGAKAIGVDAFFAMSVEPWAPGLDRELAAAFAEVSASVPVVLAYDSLQPIPEGLPLYMLASIQEAMGFANFTLDSDNFVRRQELRTQDANAWESFAARLASAARGVQWGAADPERRAVQFGPRPIPLDSSGFLMIHYWGPAGTFPAVSLVDVLAAAQKDDTVQLQRWFRDRIVLVGTLDPMDQQSTPFYLARGGQGLTPGVEIQANILATLLEQRFLREVSPTVSLALIVAGAILAAGFIFRVRFPLAPVLLLGVVVLYLMFAVRLQRSGLILPVVAPVLAVVLSGFASYGGYSLTEGRQRRLLQEVFGQYVSPDLARELLEMGEIPLGGTRQRVTVMFSDLRNYTQYCQGRPPEQVVEELNEYFAEMTAEIKAHGGMVNKFIGDGIMALFGAPVPRPEDARRAVACALHMIRRNEEYNRRRAARGLEPLVIGIALHTGEAVVGTIGAPEKMEYTGIGDTINIASRIEGENKTFQTRLLISEATYQSARESITAELAGYAHLKGVDKPVALYKVLEGKGGASCSIGSSS